MRLFPVWDDEVGGVRSRGDPSTPVSISKHASNPPIGLATFQRAPLQCPLDGFSGDHMADDLIHQASIVEETRRRYLTYALSVIS